MRHILYIATLFALLCCSGHPSEVRLKGEFAHLEQGEFLIYSDNGTSGGLDTLKIRDGAFAYALPLQETTTLHMLYPNQSELVIFATPGADVRIKGDAYSLSEVAVSGDENNEVYTDFRMATNGKSAAETRATARDYLLEHPTQEVSHFLFTTYFLSDSTATASETAELYDSLCRACPEDLELSRLAVHVRSKDLIKVGNPLPDFSLTLKPGLGDCGDTLRQICRDDYKGKYLFIAFWASWKSGSQSANYRARRLRHDMKQRGKELSIISYSLDTDESRLRQVQKSDSIDYPLYCDFLSLSSPLAMQWGICTFPFYILVNPDGEIVATGSEWMREIDPVAKTW